MRNLDSFFDGAARSAPNPFREDVFASGITPLPGVTEIHGEAMTRCIRAFESLLTERHGAGSASWSGSGRTLLIAAPRAGYGKSHLVGRVRAVTESLIAPMTLPFDPARKVAWETILVSVFNQYRSARCPQHPGCSLFEETARYFQSLLARTALEHGVIDEKEIPETEIALRLQFREVFDPRASTRMVAWLTKRSPEIMDAVAASLGARWRVEFDDLVFWNRFFQDAARPKTAVFEELRELRDATARDRVTQFLRIASDCRPLAFIADHLDGFFGSDTAGMRIAEILTELRFAVPRSVTLLCLNEDVWQSIFEGKIPSAWIDRLTGEAAPLGEMSPEEAETLLRSRFRDVGYSEAEAAEWLARHRDACVEGDAEGGLYPREVLRRAAREWDREAARRREESPAAPPAEPAPRPADPVFVAERPESPPPPPAPMPQAPDPARRGRMDESSAAARAAGVDVTRGLTNIEAIIADIRGGGSRALSETQSPSGVDVPPRQQMPYSPPSGPPREPAPVPPTPAAAREERTKPNPFWARDLDGRLRDLEKETRAAAPGGRLEWQPRRLYRVIGTVGAKFPAVAQGEEYHHQRPCLTWRVRGALVGMGFEAPEHFPFWSAALARVAASGPEGKLVLFSHPASPFNYDAIAAMGADPDIAMRHVDVLEVSDGDLALIYASERLIDEAGARGEGDQALRVVAKRLDPFWRRIGQPLRNAGAAG